MTSAFIQPGQSVVLYGQFSKLNRLAAVRGRHVPQQTLGQRGHGKQHGTSGSKQPIRLSRSDMAAAAWGPGDG